MSASSPDPYPPWLGKAGGRKFLLTVFVQILNAGLVWHDDITSETYGIVVCATVGAYIAGNAYQAIRGASQ